MNSSDFLKKTNTVIQCMILNICMILYFRGEGDGNV
jgi:hypothetical protein